MKRYKSCAQWPKGVFDSQNNYTEDEHEFHEQAYGVCHLLETKGAGGDGKEFPIKTWVDFTDEAKKEQDALRFEMLEWRLKYGSYRQYKNTQSVGCVVYWLKAYGADNCYEHIQVGNGKVYLWNKLIGTFIWRDLQPIFTFQLFSDDDGGYTRGVVKNLKDTQEFYLNYEKTNCENS